MNCPQVFESLYSILSFLSQAKVACHASLHVSNDSTHSSFMNLGDRTSCSTLKGVKNYPHFHLQNVAIIIRERERTLGDKYLVDFVEEKQ